MSDTRRVEITYTGIISMVPEPAKNAYRAVVQNAEHADEPHYAWILLSMADRPEVYPPMDPLDSKDGRVAYPLQGDATIENKVTSKSLDTNPSFHQLVLDLTDGCHQAYPGADKIRSRCLRADCPELVSARFLIAGGELSATTCATSEWRWEAPGARWRRIAQEVTHTFDVVVDPARPSLLVSFGQGRYVILHRDRDDTNGFKLVVGNTMKEDIFPTKKCDEYEGDTDHHVRMYYDLSEVTYPHQLRPGLLRRKIKALPKVDAEAEGDVVILRIGGSNCPPGLWRA